MPKLTPLLISLPGAEDTVLKDMNIWQNKPEKLKRDIITQDYK